MNSAPIPWPVNKAIIVLEYITSSTLNLQPEAGIRLIGQS